jgi:hypothetical protein
MPYSALVLLTVVETALFSKLWPDYWTEEERGDFAAWLANHADAGDLIPGSGGCRKVRWSRAGMGKRGGVRVIYYVQTTQGRLCLLLIYAKSAQDNIPGGVLRKIREELDDA